MKLGGQLSTVAAVADPAVSADAERPYPFGDVFADGPRLREVRTGRARPIDERLAHARGRRVDTLLARRVRLRAGVARDVVTELFVLESLPAGRALDRPEARTVVVEACL